MSTIKAGVKVIIGGREYEAPELPLRHVKRILPGAKAQAENPETERGIELSLDIVSSSLSVNYPEMDKDFLLDHSTFLEVQTAAVQILEHSGFTSGKAVAMG